MKRCEEREVLDGDGVDDCAIARAYRELHHIHHLLGTTRTVLRLLRDERAERSGSLSKVRVLDIGCGQGAMLKLICSRLDLLGIGFDLRPLPQNPGPIPILKGNAVYDALPPADVAICVMMAHHLSPDELEKMIHNVSRSCRRFVIVDLVRHSFPLMLFKTFLCPFLSQLNALDGQTSIRRSFTASEMKQIAQRATENGITRVHSLQHSVAPFWIRQVVDIRWDGVRRQEAKAAIERIDAETEFISASLG